jgi:hypothetical protein
MQAIYTEKLKLLKWFVETKACTLNSSSSLDISIQNGNWDMLVYLKQASSITWNYEQLHAMIITAEASGQASIATKLVIRATCIVYL